MRENGLRPWVRVLVSAASAGLFALVTAASAHAQGVIEYYGTDALGSVRVVFNTSGTLLARTDYLPYGEELATEGPATTEKFTGQARDAEAGQDYFHARMYQPRTGRMSTVDPVYVASFDPQSFNRYAYVGNNPVSFTDPSGLCKANFCVEVFGSYPGGGGVGGGSGQQPGGGEVEGKCEGGDCGGSPAPPAPIPPQLPPIFPEFPIPPLPPVIVPPVPPLPPPPPPPGPTSFDAEKMACHPGFIDASNDAWRTAGIGFADTEAGFTITGPQDLPTFRPLPRTNQTRTITNIPVFPNTLAIVHTHPNSTGAPPSDPDVASANGMQRPVPWMVLGNRGLWVYDPGNTPPPGRVVRPGLEWLKPCNSNK